LKRYNIIKIYNILYQYYGGQNWWPAKTKWEVVIGAILTQNTNWKNAESAISNLKKEGCLEFDKICQLSQKNLEQLIKPSGYYKQKTRKLFAFMEYIDKEYEGNPAIFFNIDKKTGILRRELLNIWGIGKETADSILLYALERPVFVIDTYTIRILKRHRIIDRDRITYDEVQQIIEGSIEKNLEIYKEFHALFVRAGKEFCKKKRAFCENCPLKILLN
jgi:endonuclease-3 related protein